MGDSATSEGDPWALLTGLRVLDLGRGDADAVTRIFADLGADVLKVEAPGGNPDRRAVPSVDGVSVAFALHNANKRSTVLDSGEPADHELFFELAGSADIVVDSGAPGQAASFGTSCADLADRFDHLVTMSVTDFGAVGPHASWQATDAVLYAMSTVLSRSGPTVGKPVLPPYGIASATAAVQAAWSALIAYYNVLCCGTGDYIDFSRFDAAVLALDPAFGSQGQAAVARSGSTRWRGRPKNQDAYPIYACRDGYVRLCLLSPRQWHGLRAWLGEPARFQDPKYDKIASRFAAWDDISALVRLAFASQTMDELVAVGRAHGVPIAAVLPPEDVLNSAHFRAVGAAEDVSLVPGVTATVPTGYYTVDGRRAGFRTPAPVAGADEPAWTSTPLQLPSPSAPQRPLQGVRVIDLGVIVAGGELSRLFADMGAEVIKVESISYPDGLRQAREGQAMSESFAWTHRNSMGFGLELRSDDGAEVFRQLVAGADAVFANFKPGTLAALGFPYSWFQQVKPGIVLAESSAFGDTGPWSAQMGYGPLVRATTGITRLWTDPDAEPIGAQRHCFFDATTIFPDHVVARITAIGALSALIRRNRTGGGARIHVSQAEAAVNQLDTLYTSAALTGSTAVAGSKEPDLRADTAVHEVFSCAGDDEWCVISIRSDSDWRAVAAVLGRPHLATDSRLATAAARQANRAILIAEVTEWTRTLPPAEVATVLQDEGVPAGPMNRADDVRDDPQLRSRAVFAEMKHPLFDVALPAETNPSVYRKMPAAPMRPAPLPGEHTREICQKVLAMDVDETDRLISDGVLFSADLPDHPQRIQR